MNLEELVVAQVLSDVDRIGQRGRLFGDGLLEVVSPHYVEVKRLKSNSCLLRIELKSRVRYFKVEVTEVF